MTAAKVWFFFMLVFGGLSFYFYYHPPDLSHFFPPQAQVQYQPVPTPAPVVVQVPVPPAQPVVYETKVLRRDKERYEIILGRTSDWFDTQIPVMVDQKVDVDEIDGLYLRYTAKLGDEVKFPWQSLPGSQHWLLWFLTGMITSNRPTDFFDTLKFRLLGDAPVCHLQVTVSAPTGGACTSYINSGDSHCVNYSQSTYDISLARYRELQEKLPLQ
jgi:hypothetical protein